MSETTEPGSYFVSNYPPFDRWNTDSVSAVRAAFAAPPAHVPLGLYLHIPFCRKRCKFCYYMVLTEKNAADIQRYVDAVLREVPLLPDPGAQLALLARDRFHESQFSGFHLFQLEVSETEIGEQARFFRNHFG